MLTQGRKRVAIVDYHLGNLFNVKRACEFVGLEAFISSDAKEIMGSQGIIMPGVGAFGDAMLNLKKLNLIRPIKDFIQKGLPFLGICLGMQLLMSESEEFGIHKGLDIFSGRVVKFPVHEKYGYRTKVPQVGWNRIFRPKKNNNCWDKSLLKGLANGEFMYFVHSFYIVPESKEIILSLTEYEGMEYVSALKQNNIFSFQFHPEKSAQKGIEIYRNFAALINNNEPGHCCNDLSGVG